MNNDFHHFQKYQKLNEYQFINNMFFGSRKKEIPVKEDTSSKDLELITKMNQEFAMSLDLKETLNNSLELIIKRINAQAANIFLIDDKSQSFQCIASKHQVYFDLDNKTNFTTYSVLCSPLIVSEECIGVIHCLNKKTSNKLFEENDRKLLETLSGPAALAIRNAKMAKDLIDKNRMQKEIEIVGEIQKTLLSKNQKENFPIAGINIPAKVVSGDFYNFAKLSEGVYGFGVADVSGKGIKSSLLMSKASSLYRCLSKTNYSAAELLDILNSEICETTSRGMFVTMLIGIYDSNKKELTLANAGHEPPIIYSDDGNFSNFEEAGPPLGIAPKYKFKETKINFKNSSMYIFTDGITEIKNSKGDMLESEGFKNYIKKYQQVPNHERLNKIVEDIIRSGRIQKDDLTIVVVDGK